MRIKNVMAEINREIINEKLDEVQSQFNKKYTEITLSPDLEILISKGFHKAEVKIAYTKLAHWYKQVEESGFKAFNTVANSIQLNYNSILNYFLNRSTNASAESFNAKIKAFRSQFRGVKNIEFFLYRLSNIYA